MHICKSPLDAARERETLTACDFCCCHLRPPGLPASLLRGSYTTALTFIWSLGERRKQVSSISAVGRRRLLNQQVRRDFEASPGLWWPSSLLWCWWPRSILVAGVSEGSCAEAPGLVPPSCSLLWHPCPLAKQSPISK